MTLGVDELDIDQDFGWTPPETLEGILEQFSTPRSPKRES